MSSLNLDVGTPEPAVRLTASAGTSILLTGTTVGVHCQLGRALLISGQAFSVVTPSHGSSSKSEFDGIWWVEIVAENGDCAARAVPIEVSSGRLRLSDLADAAGTVRDNGALKAAFTDGVAVLTASGALGDTAGSGRWKTSDCSGHWSARRN